MHDTDAILREAQRLRDEASTYIEPVLLDLIVKMAKQLDRVERSNQSLNRRLNGLDKRTSHIMRIG